MKLPILKNKKQQDLFDKQGFIVVPFLSPQEVEEILVFFNENNPDPVEGFYSSSYHHDYSYKEKHRKFIERKFERGCQHYFQNYQAIGGAFLHKTPVPESKLPMHQDWTIVDETKYVAINVWVPLQDVNEQNGVLQVLPGSHKLDTLRAPTLPFVFRNQEDLIYEHLLSMEVAAGSAVILNQNLIHYSPANRGNQTRVAITAGILSAEAPLQLYYFNKENSGQLDVFEQENNFLLRFDDFFEEIFHRPKIGEFTHSIPFHQKKYSDAEVNGLIKTWKNKTKGASAQYSLPILKDDKHEKELLERGFTIIPILKESEIEQLKERFMSCTPTIPKGLFASAHSSDMTYRKQMNDAIRDVLAKHIDEHCIDCQLLGGTFMVKGNEGNQTLPPHQDWSIVDERKYRSFNVWIPLVDTNLENGGIGVIEGSHLFRNTFRGANIPSAYRAVLPELWEQLEYLAIPKGHALIYDHRLIHGSAEKHLKELRMTVVCGLIPKQAELLYHYREGNEIAA